MQPAFKLKLLGGPLSGRELLLPVGTLTLGDAAADLALTLEGGATATLEVSEAGVALASPTPCWVGGRRQAPGPLPLHQVVDLAGVCLIVGAVDAELGHPAIPRRARTHRFGGGRLLGALVLVLVLVLAGVLGWALMPPPVPAPPGVRDWLPQALLDAPGLQARWLDAQTLALSGRCRDSRQLQALSTRLRAAGVRLRTETVCRDELEQSVRALMAGFGDTEVSVTLDDAGHADIDAALSSGEPALAAVLAAALDRIPGLTSWRLSDRGADELAALVPRLQSAGLLAGLSATRGERGWLLSGELDEARQARLVEWLQRANAEAGRAWPLRFVGAARSGARADYLPAPIAGVGGNAESPFVRLANGMRLLVGSPVAHNMRVVAISAQGVSLAGSRALIFIPLHQ